MSLCADCEGFGETYHSHRKGTSLNWKPYDKAPIDRDVFLYFQASAAGPEKILVNRAGRLNYEGAPINARPSAWADIVYPKYW